MTSLALRRLAAMLPTAFGVATLVFFLLHAVPGDPVDLMLGESAQVADKEALREALGLDRPLTQQYAAFLLGALRGDLGRSIVTGLSVGSLLAARFTATVKLALAAIALALLFSLPLGVAAALGRGSWIDRASLAFALAVVSVPNFWLGPMLIIVFAIQLDLLPVSGSGTWAHLLLPALTLGLAMSGMLTRMTRGSLVEALSQDYVRTARAKGLSHVAVIAKHGIVNALPPVVTVVGLEFGSLLAGTVITETIFAWPGLGRLTIEAINQRDYPVVQGCVLLIGICFVVANTLADLLQLVLEPRMRQR